MKRNYPVGIQNFEKIRNGNYCYIDKTDLIYQLIKSGQYYFLSRLRRSFRSCFYRKEFPLKIRIIYIPSFTNR